MCITKNLTFSLFIALVSSASLASDGGKHKFVCDFEYGATKNFDGQNGYSSTASKIGRMVFDQIDLSFKTGRVIGSAGREDVSLIAWENEYGMLKVHILEKGEAFNIMFTTIYIDKKTNSKKFPAVHSRHVSIGGGGPFPSNYLGYCNLA